MVQPLGYSLVELMGLFYSPQLRVRYLLQSVKAILRVYFLMLPTPLFGLLSQLEKYPLILVEEFLVVLGSLLPGGTVRVLGAGTLLEPHESGIGTLILYLIGGYLEDL